MADEQKKNLLMLTSEVNDLERELILHEGELDAFLEAKFAEVKTQLANKVDAYDWRMKALMDRAEVFEARAASYLRVAKGMKAYVNGLKDRIKLAMKDVLKTDELSGNEVRFKLSPAKDALVILDPGLIPKSYEMQVTTTEWDKARLREDLEAKKEIPGVKLEPSFSLRTYAAKSK